ncbi:MAG TPA: hypothetical protein VM427_08135 [Patescibacteria group bacterium]|nr:hypothetical protein [Patescibacteria group bacterium]
MTAKVRKPLPPCPDKGSAPPGHRKVTPPPTRPCGDGGESGGNDRNGNDRNGNGSGVVIVLPIALGAFAATARRRIIRSARTRGSSRRRRPGARGPA